MKLFRQAYEQDNGLPVGYTEVEYIESTGEQYIDTGITGTNENLGIDVTWAFSNNNANMCIFSSRSAQTSNSFTLFWLKTASNKIRFDTTGQPYFANGVNESASDDIFNFNYKSAAGAISTLTNKTTGQIQTLNTGKLTTFSTNPLYLFASRDNGAVGSSIKMYSCQIYDSNTPIRNFIPVIDPLGHACMYDMVGKKAYYNQGSGEFTYGRKIIPVEYLESSGTQWIDTGIDVSIANTNVCKVITDFAILTSPSSTGINAYTGIFGAGVPRFGAYGIYDKICFGYCSAYDNIQSFNFGQKYNLEYTVTKGSQEAKLDGTSIWTATNTGTLANTYKLGLFCRTQSTVQWIQNARIYNFKFYDNGNLICDFIPCKDENGVGFMLDRVSHTIYDNVGTGNFTYGKDATKYKTRLGFVRPMGGVLRRLPKGFTEVEYLESSGTQYIDTGVYPTQLTEVEYRCAVTGSVSNNDSHLFGSRLSASSEAFDLAYMNTSANGLEKFRFIHGIATTQETATSVTASQLKNHHTYYMSGTSFKVDGSEKMSFTTTSFAGTYSLWLFGVNSAGSLHNQVRAQRVYKCTIWDNEVLVRYFIPCLDASDTPCMYDGVEGKVYYNKGTGNFAYGKKIIPVEYIESTGTQYIDTDVVYNENTGLDCGFAFTPQTITSAKHLIGGQTNNTRYNPLYCTVVDGSNKIRTLLNIDGSANITRDFDTDYHTLQFNTYSDKKVVYDGVVEGTVESIGTGNSINLFRRNFSTGYTYCNGRLYYVKLYDNDTLIRDFIPVIDEDNTAYMFDRVTHTLFANAGTGTFLYGNKKEAKYLSIPKGGELVPPTYRKLEYLESTGTQYINTGVIFSDSSHTYKWDIGAQAINTSNTNYNWFCGLFENGAYSAGTYGDTTTNYNFYAVGTYYQNGQVITSPLTNGDKYGIIRNVFTITNFAGTLPIILFGRNQSNGVKCEATKKVFYYKLYDNDILVRNFVPVLRKSDNKPGMFDIINQIFYVNAASGVDFNYG